MPADPATPPAPAPVPAPVPSGSRTARRILTVVALTALVALLHRLATPHNFFDLKIYMKAMRWWTHGHPLYDYAQSDRVQGELYFTYPPFTALLLRPFASLTLGFTVTLFTAATVAAVLLTTWWLIAPIADRHGLPRWFATGLAVPLIFAVESVRETLNFGQINMLLVTLILADLLFAVPRNSRWAGLGTGLATAVKLFPGIFIIYLLATRRWRAAAVASLTAAGATLLAGVVVPGDSWRFWTQELWATGRVGRTDYTGNQSLFGLLSRITAPHSPDRRLWLALLAVVAGYGLYRAARAARSGDLLTGLTLTGLVGVLVSPITWTHHAYWFIPAVVVLVDAGWPPRSPTSPPESDPGFASGPEQRRRRTRLRALAVVVYVAIAFGVVSYHDWGVAPEPTDSPPEFLLRNTYVLLALLLLVVLPIRGRDGARPGAGPKRLSI